MRPSSSVSTPAARAARSRAGVALSAAPAARPARRGAPRRAAREPGPAREVDDRDQPAVLEVEAALALAAVLDDEVAQEAGRRAVRQREAGEEPQQAGMRPGRADPRGERRGAAGAPQPGPGPDGRDEEQAP